MEFKKIMLINVFMNTFIFIGFLINLIFERKLLREFRTCNSTFGIPRG